MTQHDVGGSARAASGNVGVREALGGEPIDARGPVRPVDRLRAADHTDRHALECGAQTARQVREISTEMNASVDAIAVGDESRERVVILVVPVDPPERDRRLAGDGDEATSGGVPRPEPEVAELDDEIRTMGDRGGQDALFQPTRVGVRVTDQERAHAPT